MIRIRLDDDSRDRLRAMRRETSPPKVRERIETTTLADAGRSAPRIAGRSSPSRTRPGPIGPHACSPTSKARSAAGARPITAGHSSGIVETI